MGNLKPCPFCGKPGKTFGGKYAKCEDMECPGCSVYAKVEDWNRRAPGEKKEEVEPLAGMGKLCRHAESIFVACEDCKRERREIAAEIARGPLAGQGEGLEPLARLGEAKTPQGSIDPALSILILEGFMRAVFYFRLPGGERVDDVICRNDNQLYWAVSAALGGPDGNIVDGIPGLGANRSEAAEGILWDLISEFSHPMGEDGEEAEARIIAASQKILALKVVQDSERAQPSGEPLGEPAPTLPVSPELPKVTRDEVDQRSGEAREALYFAGLLEAAAKAHKGQTFVGINPSTLMQAANHIRLLASLSKGTGGQP